ncbi:sporulation integral membrane protein YlbJ [Anaerosinus massiliensis]|uniref:sporulation integral membrane protein YlbJ n=1 Tax=Massilibacillus massiliensis TaxID=1806837 RepID=UPI000B0531FB|nr:sporulation integral membrane protein YlbJ [Massilibacillus massiliensis]
MPILQKEKSNHSKILTYFIAFCTLLLTAAMIQYPKETFDSAIIGLNLWWNVVFPSLLPFFILSEILMGIGVVHALGILLEPLMRPIFNVPGIGAFALSMGLASGYPMDAVITCKFRKNKLCSTVEAERLLAFTNTADPLFMFGAVAVGMFAMPELGSTIAISHYLASFLVGLIYRFYGRNRDQYHPRKENVDTKNIFIRAFHELYVSRKKDNRTFSALLGDSIKSSMNTILLIGGFIILFSVFLKILSTIGVTNYLDALFSLLLGCIGFSTNLAQSLSIGLFEIDLGALSASQAIAPLSEKVAIAGAIIAWSGLSVHGQVASIVIEAGINMTPYMVARLLHAILSAILTLLFLGPWQSVMNLFTFPVMTNSYYPTSIFFWVDKLTQTLNQLVLILFILLSISLVIHIFKKIFLYTKR